MGSTGPNLAGADNFALSTGLSVVQELKTLERLILSNLIPHIT